MDIELIDELIKVASFLVVIKTMLDNMPDPAKTVEKLRKERMIIDLKIKEIIIQNEAIN